jgi:hypothetical protein
MKIYLEMESANTLGNLELHPNFVAEYCAQYRFRRYCKTIILAGIGAIIKPLFRLFKRIDKI